MTPDMLRYLSLSYRRDVLGDRTAKPVWSEGLRAEAITELKRINALGGLDLAQRDFASHQHRSALMHALGGKNV